MQNFVNNGVLKEQFNGEYRLKRPLSIVIKAGVIDTLKEIYREDYENGGLLEARISGKGSLEIATIHVIANSAKNGYTYAPNGAIWNAVIDGIISRGNLPFALHTHPLKLGIESYDSKRALFYLKPSPSDKKIARAGITESLNLPEVLFTKDSRLQNGFGISFYTGHIFPASITAFSTGQIVATVGAALAAVGGRYGLALAGAGYFLYEFNRRAKYTYLGNGDMKITLTA